MAPKAELPLYYHKERVKFSRRKYPSRSNRQSRSSRCWWVFIVIQIILLTFVVGVLVGVQIQHKPGLPTNGAVYTEQNRHEVPSQGEKFGMSLHSEQRRSSNPDLDFRPRDRNDGSRSHPEPHPVMKGGMLGLEQGDWLTAHSFHAQPNAFLTVDDNLDQSEVTSMAWVYMDDAPRSSSSIRAVLGNRLSGCGADAPAGFALYINEWEKTDGKLWFELGNGPFGCQKISSNAQVPRGRWVHLAARLDSKELAIFIDGNLEAREQVMVQRKSLSREKFAIGAFSNGDYAFKGKISAVAVYDTALTNKQVHKMVFRRYLLAPRARRHGDELKTYELLLIGVIMIKEMAWESGSSPLSEAIDCSSTKDGNGNLRLALQLDEVAGGDEKKHEVSAMNLSPVSSVNGVYHFPDGLYILDDHLKDGTDSREITQEMKEESDNVARKRAVAVKEAMQHAWSNYKQYAWGSDVLLPRSKKSKDNWGGMGVTLVDSLDTLWLMDMKNEFWEARDWVKEKLSFKPHDISVFETTIRELGGLLSAYDLSGDDIFKQKAKELADKMLPAFNTQSGFPAPRVHLGTGSTGGSNSNIAEVGTLQVEFRYLSEITGDRKYADKVNHVFDEMATFNPPDGLFPIHVNLRDGRLTGTKIAFGALGDSFYEYLLKVWLQGGQVESSYREMYDKAMDGMVNLLLKKSSPSGLTYVTDWDGHRYDHKMDHLACFLPGVLALGSVTTDDKERAERDMKVAKALTYTCYQMYKRQRTGLAPEMVRFDGGMELHPTTKTKHNLLRPETAEALFVLHQLTGDPIYREWSWEIFQRTNLCEARGHVLMILGRKSRARDVDLQFYCSNATSYLLHGKVMAFEQYCRMDGGYGSHPDVNNPSAKPDDSMESFFLAETLKYLYLIQAPDNEINLRKYVFNTEAHPTRIFDPQAQ